MSAPVIVEAKELHKDFVLGAGLFHRGGKIAHAVDGVSFTIRRGETLGLVGESGCGKTTTGRLVLGLLEPTSGTVDFEGRDIFQLPPEEFQRLRRRMQIIFQDPFASLNPRKTLEQILAQPYLTHGLASSDEARVHALELLEQVGISPAEQYVHRYPHELSGGQRQRLCIARAVAVGPSFIVADEPVSALDVSVRAQILNLLRELQQKLNLTLLFITHDLSLVRAVCDRVAVMYLGRIVELASVEDLFQNPLHPYTQALLEATPIPNPRAARTRKRLLLQGDVPSLMELPTGCRFQARCPYRMAECTQVEPQLLPADREHYVACYLIHPLDKHALPMGATASAVASN